MHGPQQRDQKGLLFRQHSSSLSFLFIHLPLPLRNSHHYGGGEFLEPTACLHATLFHHSSCLVRDLGEEATSSSLSWTIFLVRFGVSHKQLARHAVVASPQLICAVRSAQELFTYSVRSSKAIAVARTASAQASPMVHPTASIQPFERLVPRVKPCSPLSALLKASHTLAAFANSSSHFSSGSRHCSRSVCDHCDMLSLPTHESRRGTSVVLLVPAWSLGSLQLPSPESEAEIADRQEQQISLSCHCRRDVDLKQFIEMTTKRAPGTSTQKSSRQAEKSKI